MAVSRITNQEVRDMYAEILSAMTASETRRDGQLGTLAGEVKGLRKEVKAQNGRARETEKTVARHDERIRAVEDCAETIMEDTKALTISNARLSVLIGGGGVGGGIIGALIVWLTNMAQIAMAGGP